MRQRSAKGVPRTSDTSRSRYQTASTCMRYSVVLLLLLCVGFFFISQSKGVLFPSHHLASLWFFLVHLLNPIDQSRSSTSTTHRVSRSWHRPSLYHLLSTKRHRSATTSTCQTPYKAQQRVQAEAEHQDPAGRIHVLTIQAPYKETLYT